MELSYTSRAHNAIEHEAPGRAMAACVVDAGQIIIAQVLEFLRQEKPEIAGRRGHDKSLEADNIVATDIGSLHRNALHFVQRSLGQIPHSNSGERIRRPMIAHLQKENHT